MRKTIGIGAIAALVAAGVFFTRMAKPREYTIGIVKWAAYGPLFVAREKGFFKDEGLRIDIKVMTDAGAKDSAYLSGSLDFIPGTPDTFVLLAAQGGQGKMIMPMVESLGGDGIVARQGIATILDLMGKKVGVQKGIASHFFLLYLLDKARMSGSDIVQDALATDDPSEAFRAGAQDAAVLWEPWLTQAGQQPGKHVLTTTKNTPGLLADVLLASPRMIQAHRADVLGFMRAWYRAVDYMKDHDQECAGIIAAGLGLDPSELKGMTATDHFFTMPEARAYFSTTRGRGPIFDVFSSASQLYKGAGMVKTAPEADAFIDASLLSELNTPGR